MGRSSIHLPFQSPKLLAMPCNAIPCPGKNAHKQFLFQKLFGNPHYTSRTLLLTLPILAEVFRTFDLSSPPLRRLGLLVFVIRTGDAGGAVSSSNMLTVSVVVVIVCDTLRRGLLPCIPDVDRA